MIMVTRKLAYSLAAVESEPSIGCDREQHKRLVSINARPGFQRYGVFKRPAPFESKVSFLVS